MTTFVARFTPKTYLEFGYDKNLRTFILNRNILFDNCVNSAFPKTNTSERFAFVNAHTVFFLYCDKNFTYNVMEKRNFPSLKNVVLWSHPCDDSIFRRFPEVKYWLNPVYKKYIPYSGNYNITMLEEKSFYDSLNFIEEEPILFEQTIKSRI